MSKSKNIHTVSERFQLTKYIAAISTLSIASFMLISKLDNSTKLKYFILSIALGAVVYLMVRVYLLVLKSNHLVKDRDQHKIQLHILLHFIPLSYLILHLFKQTTFLINLLYAVPVIIFFLTGRQTWKILYKKFGSKMYQFFIKGNTAMLIGPTILLFLGSFYKELFITEFYNRVLMVYFFIHVLIIGIAVVKIEHDFISNK